MTQCLPFIICLANVAKLAALSPDLANFLTNLATFFQNITTSLASFEFKPTLSFSGKLVNTSPQARGLAFPSQGLSVYIVSVREKQHFQFGRHVNKRVQNLLSTVGIYKHEQLNKHMVIRTDAVHFTKKLERMMLCAPN